MRISIGVDHRGFQLKSFIINHFSEYKWLDVGAYSKKRVDYPIFAKKVCKDILEGRADLGILICGSGIGVSIAANRFKGLRAGLGWSVDAARSIRNDEDSNVLALPAEILKGDAWKDVIDTWLATPFANAPRYRRRNKQLDEF